VSDAHASGSHPGYAEGEPPRKLEADVDNAGRQSWRDLLRLDAEIFAHRGIRMLTPEARVLINLKLSGPMSVTAAMELAGVSYRGFYAVLDRLKQAGLVDQVKDQGDQRVRNLQLDPATPISSVGP
jgi:DNA-binding MarR family transcriptional regulator